LLPARLVSLLAISLISVDDKIVRLTAHTIAPGAVCPNCRCPSSQIHDGYVRQPMDLPWRGYTVRFSLRVRRFRCSNVVCSRLPGGGSAVGGPALIPVLLLDRRRQFQRRRPLRPGSERRAMSSGQLALDAVAAGTRAIGALDVASLPTDRTL
jgi:transposase